MGRCIANLADDKSRITVEDWYTGAVYALCNDDRCSWKHREALAERAAIAHAETTGHSVTVTLEKRRAVHHA